MPVPAAAAPPPIALPAPQLRGARRQRWLPLLVLAGGLIVTGQLMRHSEIRARHELQASFDFSVREARTRIEQRMIAYQQVLRSAEGLLSHAESISRDEFRRFIGKLRLDENYPGIQGVSFAQIVPDQHKQRHIAAVRRAGFPTYTIFPAGQRAMYAAVIYIEPFSGRNLRAFGHDPYSDATRRAAMERARDFDLPVISSKVTLSQENEQAAQAGFVMYLPVFRFGAAHGSAEERRANVIGWVAAPFRMNDLMNGLLGEQTAKFDIAIFDGDSVAPDALMYDPDGDITDGKHGASLLEAATRIRVANHDWTLHMRSLPAFEAGLDRDSPRLIAYGGVGISVLLALLTLVLANGRERALQAARRMNRDLIDSETRYRQMFQDTASIAYLLDPDSGRIVDANDATAEFTGYTLEQLRGMNIGEINTASPERLQEVMRQVRDGQGTHFEWRHRIKSGEVRDVEVFTSPLAYRGKVLLYSILHDISARKQAEQALAAESAKNAMLLRTAVDGIHVLDPQGNVLQANDAFCGMLGYTPEQLVRMNIAQFAADMSAGEIREKLVSLLDQHALFETRLRRRDGSLVDVEIQAGGVVIAGQQRVYASARDITERKKAAEQVLHLATFDILTDLPNRALLYDRLQQALVKARRYGSRLALMFLDLDKFKPVNDLLGHQVGDMLLKEVALRLQRSVRESDTVARVGGDEFVVLLPNIEDKGGAQLVAQKILSALQQPFALAGHTIAISASIGIALYPEHGEDQQQLVKSADEAMYLAKHAGGSSLLFFGERAHQTATAPRS